MTVMTTVASKPRNNDVPPVFTMPRRWTPSPKANMAQESSIVCASWPASSAQPGTDPHGGEEGHFHGEENHQQHAGAQPQDGARGQLQSEQDDPKAQQFLAGDRDAWFQGGGNGDDVSPQRAKHDGKQQ